MQTSPQVASNEDRLVCTPYKAAAEKGKYEDEAIIQLSSRSSHAHLIEEPVDVEKGRGQLPKDEVATIVVDKRALLPWSVSKERSANLIHDPR